MITAAEIQTIRNNDPERRFARHRYDDWQSVCRVFAA